ncbi:MAG: RDD family protein, partial [Planctomycetaceae bacterium]
ANAKASMLWWGIAFCVMLPALGATAGIAAGGQQIYDGFHTLNLKVMGFMVDTEKPGFLFKMLLPFTALPILFAGAFLFSLLQSFSGVFLMRAAGLFTYYNKRTLNMGDKRQGDQPADFWVRYLQLICDCFVVLALLAVVEGIIFGLCYFGQYLMSDDKTTTILEQLGPQTWNIMGGAAFLVPFGYFVFTESGPGKGTLGMHGVGIYIIDQYGNSPIDKGPAITRFFLRLVTLGLSGLSMLFDKHKRALHDQSTQTHVVWKREVH